MITLPLSSDIQAQFFLIEEMVVNETTNTLYMIQDSYTYQRLWILQIDSGTWSYIDFPSLGADYPQHLAVSEATNKVFVKVIGQPGNSMPGLYVLNRNDGTSTFIGAGDFGPMVVNEATNRLYTGVEVDQQMAIVDVVSNSLTYIPMEGATTGIGVRHITDHAFLANSNFIAMIDGASRTFLKIPLGDNWASGLLVQDVAINQATGWVYVIFDDRKPQVIGVLDSPPPWHVYVPFIRRN